MISDFDRDVMSRELGKAIRGARLMRNMSQADLARKTGINRSNLARLEGGGYALPNLQTLVRLARALEVKPSALVRSIDEWC